MEGKNNLLVFLEALEDMAQRVKDGYTTKKDTEALSGRVQTLEKVGAQANVIEEIKVNGVAQQPSEKSVDITVPKTVAELDTGSAYATKTYVGEQIAGTDHLQRKKVDSKDSINPAEPGADKYIYMVPKTGGKNGDKYDEYMVIDGTVEPVGDWAVNLDGYAKIEDIPEIEASETNGSISIDGDDVKVYELTDAEIAKHVASKEDVKAALDAIFGAAEE